MLPATRPADCLQSLYSHHYLHNLRMAENFTHQVHEVSWVEKSQEAPHITLLYLSAPGKTLESHGLIRVTKGVRA